ncbi:alkyl hydroperoxide reductase subunit F [Halanaerobium praevalens]|uniref:Alkyl hydroperoxide reductase, F subunit n=1 Tax=Halanaerobium praevalens (strain ATCC 33744 / DSM 2228 / GSL) TaxID=572479 RepID=E3DQQ2_HALPG|nr:alkyl hydroperoxide reductase subunit F [Halanaerobium praevalens]ADO77963.1 alkyl hydroperoxide reductase, F subunit [Halanaerobium praevalens DSM 2228]
MLEADIKEQLKEYFQLLEANVLIKASIGSDQKSKEMHSFLKELASLSSKLELKETSLARTPSFSLTAAGQETGVSFAGIPLGHELNSLVLALLQASGREPKVEAKLIKQIKNIEQEYNFETYISLSCNNCPDVVQALNIMSIINPNITHTMIDGAFFKGEVEEKSILAVPAIYLNGEFFKSGRLTLTKILEHLVGKIDNSELNEKDPYDVLIVGGGPAAASAAIYAARKGIKTAIVAERFGGQVLDTAEIENFIGQKNIEGSKLISKFKEHIEDYDIDLILSQKAKSLEKNELVELELESGAVLKSKTLIAATGASWRQLNIPGEAEFKNKGVAYCPHCDGPMFEDKDVAVIGGGNSGVEAAIDLAGIAKSVTLLEFLPELKADQVLQNRLEEIDNLKVIKNVDCQEIKGTDTVNAISYVERDSGQKQELDLDGVFVQIGLKANTDWLKDKVELNQYGEIITTANQSTNLAGVFAAGDCADSIYKQIVISIGSGASAALAAFDYLIRN